MSRIGGKIAWEAALYATKPERLLRSLLHRHGFRFTGEIRAKFLSKT